MEQNSEKVVLVHGVASHRSVMWPIAYRLWYDGFRAETWSYITFFRSIESHADRFAAYISKQFANESKVHIVAHSMGSIVVRVALNRIEPSRVGRIVLLAPPNAGSPVARIISKLSCQMIVPALELSDQPGSYVNRIESTNDFEIGVLAAKYDFLVLFHFDSVTKPASSFRALSRKVSIHDRYNRRSIGAQRVPVHLLL